MTESNVLTLTWWEAEELISHLASRSDIWSQSSESEHLWFREDDDVLQCGLLFHAPSDPANHYRLIKLSSFSYEWDAEQTETYARWLLANWTSFPHRQMTEKFLQTELKLDPETAFASAVALEALDWTEVTRAEEPTPPIQEDLWSRDVPRILVEDHSHIGTYLLSGGTGWIRIRLTGGMLRIQLSIRAKDGVAVPLDGFIRPRSADARTCAAKLAGWPPSETTRQDRKTQEQMIAEYDADPENRA